MKLFPLFVVLSVTTAYAQEQCATVIALSKITTFSASNETDVKNHAANFCSEYSQYKSQSSSHQFGASYKFLAASFGNSNASVDEVASRYCSSDNSSQASARAYQNYIESIAPGAFSAYARCLDLKNNRIEFRIQEATVLPKQFAMTVTYNPPGRNTTHFAATPSDGVSCKWDNSNGVATTVTSPAVATLLCIRANHKQRSFVTVAQLDGEATFTVPWQAYNDEGVPVEEVFKRIESQSVARDAEIQALKKEISDLKKSKVSRVLIRQKHPATETGYVKPDAYSVCPFSNMEIPVGVKTNNAFQNGLSCAELVIERD